MINYRNCSRTKKILILVIILALLLAGFYFYSKNRSIKTFENSALSDYQIKESEGYKIIENTKEGLTAKIPSTWTIKKIEQEEGDGIEVYDPNMEFDEKGEPLVKKGCLEKGSCVVGMMVAIFKDLPNYTSDADLVRGSIEHYKNNPGDSYSVEKVDGKESLRKTFADNNITMITVQTPVGQKLYAFASGPIKNAKCIEEFNKFLENVKIKASN